MLTRRRALRGIRIDAEAARRRPARDARRADPNPTPPPTARSRASTTATVQDATVQIPDPSSAPTLHPTPWRARRRERERGGRSYPEGVADDGGGGKRVSGVGGFGEPLDASYVSRGADDGVRGEVDRARIVGTDGNWWVSRGAVSELGVGASVVDVVDEREAPGGALVGDAAGERADEGAPVATGAHQAVQDERQGSFRRAGGSGRGLDHLERQRRRLVRRREASAPGDTIEGAEGRPTPRPRRAPLLRGADAPRRHRTIDRARQGAHRPRIARERAARARV